MGEQDKGYSAGSILLTFLMGAVVGAGVALLVAPKTGEETRKRIKELADDAKEKAEEYIEQVKGKATTYIEKGKDILEKEKTLLSDYVDKGKEFVEKEKSVISKAVEAGKEAYEKEKKAYQPVPVYGEAVFFVRAQHNRREIFATTLRLNNDR